MTRLTSPICVALLVLLASGCDVAPKSGDPAAPDAGITPAPLPDDAARSGFESDLPSRLARPTATDAGTALGSSGGDAGVSSPITSGSPSVPSGSAAVRAVTEADIIQTSGDTLYALSVWGGLTIIDMADPSRMRILGRYRELHGMPFEMYLRSGVVLAMYSAVNSGSSRAQPTSKVIALDVRDPAAVTVIASFDIAGQVSESRMIDDILYVVALCPDCVPQRTSIVSLNTQNPRDVRKVDELSFRNQANGSYAMMRTVTFASERIYVSGDTLIDQGDSPGGSNIQVIDISAKTGELVEGTRVSVAGVISARWQMDEHLGVLRVVGQPNGWQDPGAKPILQTFKVVTARDVTPLASLPLVIPPEERLDSVRFDGLRGYALTSKPAAPRLPQRIDPLVTLDLSDPAHPRQVGQLEFPGWIYHVVPRGDRLLGLGYDPGNAQGTLTVTLFDVADLATPRLLDRVNFGGDVAWLAGHQDRIEKAFRILAEEKLLLVPFGRGAPRVGNTQCSPRLASGVQLVDLQGDDLALRGAAMTTGAVTRALLHKQKLLAIREDAIDTFDLSDRDRPARVARLTTLRLTRQGIALSNDTVARIHAEGYGRTSTTIDFVARADAEKPDVRLSEIDLNELLDSGNQCQNGLIIQRSFATGSEVHVGYSRYGAGWTWLADGIVSIEAADPTKPTVLGKVETWNPAWLSHRDRYREAYTTLDHNSVLVDRVLVSLGERVRRAPVVGEPVHDAVLSIVDVRDPRAPKFTTVPLPVQDGYSSLVADAGKVMLSHFEITAEGRGRFYVEQVDLSTPGAATLTGKRNVPGALLHYDHDHRRMLTGELIRTVVPGLTREECGARFAYDFTYAAPAAKGSRLGTCTGYGERLHLLRMAADEVEVESTYDLPENRKMYSSSMSDGHVVALIDDHSERPGRSSPGDRSIELLTLAGLATGELRGGSLRLPTPDEPSWGFAMRPIHAFGTRALVSSKTQAFVVDFADATSPTLVRTVPLQEWFFGMSASGSNVLMTLGSNGIQSIDLR